MVTGLSNNFNSDYVYVRQNSYGPELAWVLAPIASGLVMKALPSFSNPFQKQMKNEWANNHLYKDVLLKAHRESGLKEKGVSIFHVGENMPVDKAIAKGENACYIPTLKQVHLNTNKASIAGFHELGHAKNHVMSKLGKLLQSCRKPGYTIAGLMGTVALFSRQKPKGEPRNAWDYLQDNCGKIAFISMLPTVAEEALASYNGIKMAKKAGLDKSLVKNLRKFYGKALLSYSGYAILAGISVYAASKITEILTRPKKVPISDFYI